MKSSAMENLMVLFLALCVMVVCVNGRGFPRGPEAGDTEQGGDADGKTDGEDGGAESSSDEKPPLMGTASGSHGDDSVPSNALDKHNEGHKHRHSHYTPVLISVVPQNPSRRTRVGYDENGVLDAPFAIKVQVGDIGFNPENNSVEIKVTAVYQMFSSLRYSALHTTHPMSHCLEVTHPDGTRELTACAIGAATSWGHGATKMWNNESKTSNGLSRLVAGSKVRLVMVPGTDRVKKPHALLLYPGQCHYSLIKVS